MASASEITLGARLENAQKIAATLQTFTGYAPPGPGLMPGALQALVAAITASNTEAAAALAAYAAAVAARQQLFNKEPGSVIKLLSAIGAAVRAAYGKAAWEAGDIAAIITRIRGIKIRKEARPPLEGAVSQSQRSYGSMLQNFSDLITTLRSYGSQYRPANPAITLSALQDLLAQLDAANTRVATAWAQLKAIRDLRTDQYRQLKNLVQRIKDAVKSQYGLQSTHVTPRQLPKSYIVL